MTDPEQTQSETEQDDSKQWQSSSNDLADELNQLGNNIKNFLQSFWESQERKRMQQEIESGLSSLGQSLSQAASEFQQSPTGQQVKQEFEAIGERIRSGEMESTLRRDFLNALRTANAELENALRKMSPVEKPADSSEDEPEP